MWNMLVHMNYGRFTNVGLKNEKWPVFSLWCSNTKVGVWSAVTVLWSEFTSLGSEVTSCMGPSNFGRGKEGGIRHTGSDLTMEQRDWIPYVYFLVI